MVPYPAKRVQDLSPDETDRKKKSLYIINLDTSRGNDFRCRNKIYGAYWSAAGPAPVNKIAVGIWSKFGVGTRIKPTSDDYDSLGNIDGRHTREGECYAGYMHIPLAINVYKVDVPCEASGYCVLLQNLAQAGLLEECLELVGISIGGSSIPIEPGVNGAVSQSFLRGVRFVLTGTYVEVDGCEQKSHQIVAKMLKMFGATVNARMSKNTNYLLVGKDPYLCLRNAAKKFTQAKAVNLATIHKLLLGMITLEDVEKLPSLTRENFKNGAYRQAATIPKTSKPTSDLEKAIDQLGLYPGQREEGLLEPLYDIFGYPDAHEKKPPSSDENTERKRQKTGEPGMQ